MSFGERAIIFVVVGFLVGQLAAAANDIAKVREAVWTIRYEMEVGK